MKLPVETHPVWRIITMAVMMGGITFCLWLNASNFDKTEITSLVEIGVWAAGYEWVKSKVAGKG